MNIKKNLFNRNHQLNWWLWFTFSSEFCLSKNKNTTHYQNYITSIIVKNFTILLNGNISIVDSLEIIKNSTGNVFIQEHLANAITEIKGGKLISKSLENNIIFNSAFINMIAIGESSENLVEILESATEYYDSKINYSVDKILQYLQPVIIIIIASFVAFIVFAIAIPIFDLSNGISIEWLF